MTGPAGTPAGRPAGTAAGTPAGTPAGTAAGSAAGTPAGPKPAARPAGSASVDPAPVSTDTTTAPATDPATTTGDVPAATGRRGAGGRRLWLAVAAAVLIAALVVAVVALVRAPSQDEVRESALVAARTYATSLTTFDARTLDDDVERVTRASTEQFAQEYRETLDGLRETVEAEGTVSAGSVVGAGVEELDGDTATVLVAVNQQLDSTAGAPRTEANRLRMVLERRDGRWLIRSVERL